MNSETTAVLATNMEGPIIYGGYPETVTPMAPVVNAKHALLANSINCQTGHCQSEHSPPLQKQLLLTPAFHNCGSVHALQLTVSLSASLHESDGAINTESLGTGSGASLNLLFSSTFSPAAESVFPRDRVAVSTLKVPPSRGEALCSCGPTAYDPGKILGARGRRIALCWGVCIPEEKLKNFGVEDILNEMDQK